MYGTEPLCIEVKWLHAELNAPNRNESIRTRLGQCYLRYASVRNPTITRTEDKILEPFANGPRFATLVAMADSRSTLYLVDASGYMFRAFHAIPPLNNSRGLPTNATFGFLRMVLKLVKDTRPSHIAMVFDPPGKTFRDDLFDSYKANRTEMPSDMGVQIPYIHRAVEALRMRRLVIEGFEADDVIGTLAVRAAREKFDSVIVTGDKDFKQLVGPHITLLDTMTDKRFGVREVREQFGVGPEAVIDIMALMGDSIDNVKGLPGVGPKTACALIQYFGSLDKLFDGLDQIEESGIRGAKKLRALIEEHRGDVELARELVRIETDVALELAPDDLVWPGFDEKALADLMRELEFNAMLAELTPLQRATPASSPEEIRVGRDDLPAVLAELARAPRLALNLAAGGDGAAALDLGANNNGAAILKFKAEGDDRLFAIGPELFEVAATLLAAPTPPKTCHDLKTHIELLRRHRIDLNGVDFDTMLAGFLVNSGKPEPSLGDLYHQYLAPLTTDDPTGSEPALVESARHLGPAPRRRWPRSAVQRDRNAGRASARRDGGGGNRGRCRGARGGLLGIRHRTGAARTRMLRACWPSVQSWFAESVARPPVHRAETVNQGSQKD
jgi:DNA polymerase-1